MSDTVDVTSYLVIKATRSHYGRKSVCLSTVKVEADAEMEAQA